MKEYIFTSTHFIKSDEKIFTSDFILKLFESQKDWLLQEVFFTDDMYIAR